MTGTTEKSQGNFLARLVRRQIFIPLAALLLLIVFNLIADPSFFAITLKENSLGDLVLTGNLITILDNASELELGAIIKADTFQSGDFVDVTGTSKGHGYTGVIKRWNASRGRMTHGGGPVHRHAGSMGSTTDPSRIFKGKIGPGQYGVETVTIQNLEVVKVDPELNMLVVRGAVPGPKGSLVTVKTTVKVHKIKQAGADISKNPQKASGRNPQKASARNM